MKRMREIKRIREIKTMKQIKRIRESRNEEYERDKEYKRDKENERNEEDERDKENKMDKEKEIKKQQMKKPVHPIHGEVVEFSFLAGDNGHPYVCEDQLELSIMLKYDVILHFNQSEASATHLFY